MSLDSNGGAWNRKQPHLSDLIHVRHALLSIILNSHEARAAPRIPTLSTSLHTIRPRIIPQLRAPIHISCHVAQTPGACSARPSTAEIARYRATIDHRRVRTHSFRGSLAREHPPRTDFQVNLAVVDTSDHNRMDVEPRGRSRSPLSGVPRDRSRTPAEPTTVKNGCWYTPGKKTERVRLLSNNRVVYYDEAMQPTKAHGH